MQLLNFEVEVEYPFMRQYVIINRDRLEIVSVYSVLASACIDNLALYRKRLLNEMILQVA